MLVMGCGYVWMRCWWLDEVLVIGCGNGFLMSHHPVVVMMECNIGCWMLWCCVLMVVIGCGYFNVLVIGCGGGAMWWLWWWWDVMFVLVVVMFECAVGGWMWRWWFLAHHHVEVMM